MVTRLWFTGARVSFDPRLPLYIGHVDGDDRVTSEPRPVASDFAFLDHIESADWFQTMSPRSRRAFVLKTVRIHVFDAIAARLTDVGLTEDDRSAIAGVVDRLRSISPSAFGLLSKADSRALRVALATGSSRATIADAVGARWNYGTPMTLITTNPLLVLHRHAPFRTLRAGIQVRQEVAEGYAARGGDQRYPGSPLTSTTSTD